MTNEELKTYIQRNADRLLCFKDERGEVVFLQVRAATEKHLRGHLRLLQEESVGVVRDESGRMSHTNSKTRLSMKKVRAFIEASWFEEFIGAVEPGFREGARTLPEAVMLVTATCRTIQ